MTPDRRSLLAGGLTLAAAAAASCRRREAPAFTAESLDSGDGWDRVRELFALSSGTVHMSAMLIASHPEPVRAAIDRHRAALDADPVVYLERNNNRLTEASRAAAGQYFRVPGDDVALTDSTTMGIGLVYNALMLRPGQELLSTEQDYFVTHESLRLAAERNGARMRLFPLYDEGVAIDADRMVARVRGAIGPATRVLALTWVHSSTGLKIPIRRIAAAVGEINRDRDEDDRVLICLDGVHGVGVEDEDFGDLGCDFLMAGCHKWLFGPRGTGVVVATGRGWRACRPVIPSFIDDGLLDAWVNRDDPAGPTTAARMTPGGFKAFEHRWAMTEAFDLHERLGRDRVARRTHGLATQLKEGLRRIDGVSLRTPLSPDLSAGIVSFDIDGLSPRAAVRGLRARRVIASVAPYATPHVRLTPSIRNSPAEIDAALRAVAAL